MNYLYNDEDAFKASTLTEAMNLIPNTYGRINQLGVFSFKGINTRSVSIESKKGQLVLLQTKKWGEDGDQKENEKRIVRSFSVPHIPHDSVLDAADFQDVRAFGQTSSLESMPRATAERLKEMKADHDITHEYMRMQCIKGKLYDGGGTLIYDWFKEFGIKQYTVEFDFSNESFDVKAACRKVVRHIKDGLLGDIMDKPYVLVDAEFMDQLTNNTQVKEAYERWNNGAALRDDNSKGFTFAGLTFEEYDASVSLPGGTVKEFIETATGYGFPLGTRQTFRYYAAPANFNNAVNTIGLPYYASAEPKKHNRGIDIHTQSNPLFMCLRPSTLVKLTIKAKS
ncbi:major capsid protein [Piscirickettsia litoralis]|uniref:Major capsid protein E n=1 Tax=Piscirickettsia litoralis TaxID=1891921 RepID=A0ABX2ZX45_9GAMM|nr:major capsid protein [Piscirickettsia litoralis]ODN41171.1 hypothetical protein BGC07_18020 [Piscirickettsia litoralis]